MLVNSLSLRNFRSYHDFFIQFDKNINIITGQNGIGKTNILEAIIFSSNAKSFRTNEDSALIRHNEEYGRIILNGDIGEIKVVINNQGKTLFINNQIIKKTSEFIGYLNAVLFKPSDLEFFNSSPRERRKIIDLELGKIFDDYLSSLLVFNRLLKDKNKLLKEDKVDDLYLDLLNEQMVPYIKTIMEQREKVFDFINLHLSNIYKEISDENISLKVIYKKNINDDIQKTLKETKEKDLAYHYALMGPHHDDYYFLFDNHQISDIASQGQTRMCLIAFKFALIKYIKEVKKIKPIILLDDVLSELDKENQRRLINFLPNDYQIIITDTTFNEMLNLKKYKLIKLNKGGLNG